MRTLIITLGLAALTILAATDAFAGDKNSIYFKQESALARVGFSGAACGAIPLPGVSVDSETNCAKVPTTYLYKLTKSDGTEIKEVRKLEDSHDEKCVRSVDAAGNPVEECSIKIVSGRSIDGNFGRRQTFSITGVTFGSGDSASNSRRTFSTGLSAARRSTQEPVEASP